MTTNRLRPQTISALQNFTLDCQDQIDEALASRGGSFDSVLAAAGRLQFFDGTKIEGYLTFRDLGLNSYTSTETLFQFAAAMLNDPSAASILVANSQIGPTLPNTTGVSPDVVLSALFDGSDVTLAHEALHYGFQQNDQQLAATLGLGSFDNSDAGLTAASRAISGWVRGCLH